MGDAELIAHQDRIIATARELPPEQADAVFGLLSEILDLLYARADAAHAEADEARDDDDGRSRRLAAHAQGMSRAATQIRRIWTAMARQVSDEGGR